MEDSSGRVEWIWGCGDAWRLWLPPARDWGGRWRKSWPKKARRSRFAHGRRRTWKKQQCRFEAWEDGRFFGSRWTPESPERSRNSSGTWRSGLGAWIFVLPTPGDRRLNYSAPQRTKIAANAEKPMGTFSDDHVVLGEAAGGRLAAFEFAARGRDRIGAHSGERICGARNHGE